MRFFPITFTTNSAGFPGAAFSRLSGSSIIWGTVYIAEREREREEEREEERAYRIYTSKDLNIISLSRNCRCKYIYNDIDPTH